MPTQQQEQEYNQFVASLPTLSDNELHNTCEQMIWLSSYANNNPYSNYHRMCDACYNEAQNRDKLHLYTDAHDKVSGRR